MSRKIAFYITAHGYGHAVRSSYLIHELAQSCEVTVVTDIPKNFFNEELSVPFNYRNAVFDCGCIQYDAVKVNAEATIRKYYEISADNDAHLDDEVLWVKDHEIDLIISDLVPFAGVIAARSDIPSVSVSNFWWDDIYSSFPDSASQQWLLRRVEEEMAHFTHHVLLNPSMKKLESSSEILSGVNLLRDAESHSDELHSYLGIDPSLKIALLYTGNYGMEEVEWSKLADIRGWHFIGIHPIPGDPANFTLISKEKYTLQEFTASVDVVVSKLGYGTVTESLATGTPILYTSRKLFAEYPVLESYLLRYKHCLNICDDLFRQVQWESSLNRLAREGKRQFRLSSDVKMISDWILAVPPLFEPLDPNLFNTDS